MKGSDAAFTLNTWPPCQNSQQVVFKTVDTCKQSNREVVWKFIFSL